MNTHRTAVSLDELRQVREQLRREGRVAVFTNGCFDLLHVGHIRCLQQARDLGDVLIVGLNSDSSVRSLKGRGRPLVPQEERAEMLLALVSVDYVIIFDELTPEGLIAALKPDVHCKGGDYAEGKGKAMPEAEIVRGYGGQVVVLPYQVTDSTTALIERIQREFADAE
jgi:D-beta-D-heptose 7-phosphate kinase/D-beta-D-heptose 1-phosphate adenosyltransferase